MCIHCNRCGEEITAPYWHDGKPYGWSCIRIVNPKAKKNKDKQHWVIADSSDLMPNAGKQFATAIYLGKKYTFFALPNSDTKELYSLDPYAKIENKLVYINIAAFKGYEKSKS